MRQNIWGEDNKDTMKATDKLASLLHDMKAYAEELPLREDLFDQTKKNYGADAQETIYAIVQDQAVTQFVWQYPCEIVTMDNANVSLLSFDEIMKIFQKQIFMNVYLDKGFPETMHITDIRFSYLRMKKLNSEEFYLLPVWDFLGYCTDEEADDPLSRSWYDNQSFLTINAIDGSIIDRNVGY